MQILSSDNIINSTDYSRVIDLSKNLVLETVPYNKVTKTPMPMKNIISRNYLSNGVYGKKGYFPYIENSYVKDNSNTSNNSYSNCWFSNFISNNVLVDNNNPSITYIFEQRSGTLYIKKCIEDDNNISYTENKISNDSRKTLVSYFTQDNNYLYAVVNGNFQEVSGYTYYGRTQVAIYKINKVNLSYSTCWISEPEWQSSSDTYISGSSYYTAYFYGIKNCKVLAETSEGLILLCSMITDYSISSGNYPYYSGNYDGYLSYEHKFYSFDTNRVTRISYTLDSSTVTAPYGSAWNHYRSISTTNASYLDMIAYPSKYIETDNSYYGYMYAGESLSSSMVSAFGLFRIEQSKSDILSSTIYKLDLVFPQDSPIQSIPIYYGSTYYGSYSFSNYGLQMENLLRYETQAFNIEGTDYVNIWFESVFYKGQDKIGCYTFKVNQAKTEATFISFYPAVGGQLNGFMPLNNSGTKILVTTPTSYHIMMFDATSEEWKTTYEETTTIDSCIQTDDDKIYFTTSDKRVICQDLEGATTIDFTFEQTSYQYNDTDITTYIQLWSKNSEDEYVETTVKLTLQGNAVWQSNGLQTLTTTTSDEGKINVPFVIKGQSTINVSVDVVL